MVAGRLRGFLTAGAVLIGAASAGFAAEAAPGRFAACLDYHCDRTRDVRLDAAAWLAVRRLFEPVPDAAGERAAIRAAIALLEDLVGRITGTWRDLAENRAGAGLPGQLDCIAESRNTTTYLQLLADDGLLRFHTVEPRVKRQTWIFNVHWTAVIRETANGRAYAVDSWFLDNGEPPFVQPLEAWRRGEAFTAGR